MEFYVGDRCRPRRPSPEKITFLDKGYYLNGVFHRIPKELWDREFAITSKKFIFTNPRNGRPVHEYTTDDPFFGSRGLIEIQLELAEPRQSEDDFVAVPVGDILAMINQEGVITDALQGF